MKKLIFLPSLIIFLISGFLNISFGQGQILSVTPNMVNPGQTTDIIIRAQGTAFKSGVSKVNCGSEITVNRVTVNNTTTIDAQITVSNSATPGSNNITVTTGASTVTFNSGLQIFQIGNKVTATMIVTPVQTMHLSDFDPNNLANSPLLFTVKVFNDNKQRTLRADLIISGQSSGEIGSAYKVFSLSASNTISFDNRQFDKYTVSSTSNPAIQTAIQTGALPSDVYRYQIRISDNNMNDTLATAEGDNFIANNINKPELISPGNPFYSDPVAEHVKQPVFQWFSQANSYDFYLYEVNPGQKSAAEVANNRPIYHNTSPIVGTSMIYPASAAIMQDGKIYAWQIVANYNGTSGATTLASDLFWFTMASSSLITTNKTVAELKVIPDQITLGAGQSYKFTAKAYDLKNDTVSITPTWSIIPSDGGGIDKNGNFVAGTTPNQVAVIATYGDFTDYANVTVTSGINLTGSLDAFSLDQFVKQLFGLPK